MRKELIKMVEKATTTTTSYYDGRGNVTENHFDKEKFASLVAKAAYKRGYAEAIEACASAIRARGETK